MCVIPILYAIPQKVGLFGSSPVKRSVQADRKMGDGPCATGASDGDMLLLALVR